MVTVSEYIPGTQIPSSITHPETDQASRGRLFVLKSALSLHWWRKQKVEFRSGRSFGTGGKNLSSTQQDGTRRLSAEVRALQGNKKQRKALKLICAIMGGPNSEG